MTTTVARVSHNMRIAGNRNIGIRRSRNGIVFFHNAVTAPFFYALFYFSSADAPGAA